MYIVISPDLFVFGTKTIIPDKGSIDTSDMFSYFILSRKYGNIHLKKEFLKTVLIRNRKCSKEGPRQLSLFPDAGNLRMEINHICL